MSKIRMIRLASDRRNRILDIKFGQNSVGIQEKSARIHWKFSIFGAAAAAAEPEYVTGKPMVSEKEKRAAVS